MQSDAKRTILRGIERAVGAPPQPETLADGWCAISRGYAQSSRASYEEVLELFLHRLQDYGAQTVRTTRQHLAVVVRQQLQAIGPGRVLVPPGFDASLLPREFDYLSENAWGSGADSQLSHAALDSCHCVVTESTLAIAETGTIVLQNTAGQGRRALSLVPDVHLCLVQADRVVATVPQAMAALQATATLPTTFLSGPSATADIEMTRIQGVHGPRRLHVVLIQA